MNAILFILLQSFVPWYLTPSTEPSKPTPQPAPVQEQTQPAAKGKKQDRQATSEVSLEAAAAATAVGDSIAQFKETIDVAILLHENPQGGVDGNMVDFYNGALIAARELGLQGRKMNIHSYDVSKDIDTGQVAECDIVLGPVSPADIVAVNEICRPGTHIISPLEPRSANLADSLAIVQVPTPAACQIKDNVCWIKEDMGPTDKILVICPEEEIWANPNHTTLINALHEQGLHYTRIKLSESIALFETPKPDTTHRVLIDGTDELFVTNVLREMTARCLEGNKMIVYHQSKVRSYENLKIEYMHSCNLHVSASYYVDYSDEDVRNFVRQYRSLFEAEPNSFAFHGYDCLKYFISAYCRYGSLWFDKLNEYQKKGMNVSFVFENQDKPGKINSGIRRMVYNPDWSVSAQ